MYAIIQDRKRQATVRKGDVILCDLNTDKKPGDEITFAFADPLPQRGRFIRAAHPIAQPTQCLIQDDADGTIVIGDENGGFGHAGSSSVAAGRRTRNCVRRGSLASSINPP